MSDKSVDFSAIVLTLVNSAASIGFTCAMPYLSAVNPLLSRVLERAFRLLTRDDTAEVECARLGIAYYYAVDTINRNFDAGKCLREDGFFNDLKSAKYSPADEIIEATLRNVVTDAETKKSEYYGRFIGQIPFLVDAPMNELITMNSIIKQLSVEDINALFRFFLNDESYCFRNIELDVKSNVHSKNTILYISVLHLKNLGLITRVYPASLGMDLENEKLTHIGAKVITMLKES